MTIRRNGRHRVQCDCCSGEVTPWTALVAERNGDQPLCEECRNKAKPCCAKQEQTMALWRKVYGRMDRKEQWWHKVAPTILFMEEEALVGAN